MAIGFLTRLVTNVFELLEIGLFDVLLREPFDPLAAVAAVVGFALIVTASGILGYTAVGALLAELGVTLPKLGDGPRGRA